MGAVLAALINGTIPGCVLAAIVYIGLRTAPRRSLNAATRYAIWWAALAVILLLPAFFLPRAAAVPAPDYGSIQIPAIVVSTPSQTAIPTLNAVASRPQRPPLFPVRLIEASWIRWILLAWGTASTLMLFRLMLSYLLLQREKGEAVEDTRQLAAEWLWQCGCGRSGVRLAATGRIGTPVAAGLWRPAILIPSHLFEELTEAELRQIGLHEAAHLARRDDYSLLLQRVLEAIWVWHPAIRWVSRQLDLEREIACDDFVVRVTGQTRPYAACLTRVVELTGGVRGSLAAAAAAEERSHLKKRVELLLDGTRNSATRLLRRRFAAVVALVAALGYTGSRLPGAVAFAMPQRPAPILEAATPTAPVQSAQTPVPPSLPLPSRPPRPGPQTAPMVTVPVVVQDPQHRSVSGLDKENFRIYEDGVEQEVAEFSTAEAPASYAIVYDASGSIGAKQAVARQAVAQFLNATSPGSEFCLVEFKQSATLAAGFTSDPSKILSTLDFVKTSGGTALWEAIVLALREMEHANNPQKAILIVSDGMNNTSSITAAQVKEAARSAGIPMSAINLSDDRRGTAFLEDLASSTGGRLVWADAALRAGGVGTLALRNVYILGYRPSNPAMDGGFRRLRVEVVAPRGLPPLTVKHRSGYYAGGK